MLNYFSKGSPTIPTPILSPSLCLDVQNSVLYVTTQAVPGWVTGMQSATNGIIAFAGGEQASAALLPSLINRVTTVGTVGDSVKLPPSLSGLSIFVVNGAANSTNVFPQSGDQINALGVNTAFGGTKTATFSCANSGQWHAILSA